MSTTTERTRNQGDLWGTRPHDWAEQEERQLPTYEEAMRRVGSHAAGDVLDVGCGAGTFLRLAAERGAGVAGLDASAALIGLARDRVPDADLHVGEMESLPFGDARFDLVTGFNSFFFASDMDAALVEAARVARPGGIVLVQVWGRPERCEVMPLIAAARELVASAEARPSPGPQAWERGVLEGRLERAGLHPADAFDLSYPFEYPDDEALLRSMLAAGGVAEVVRAAGAERTADAILAAAEPNRASDGSYRLANEWHFATGRKP